ncbi:MAG: zinc transport system substrate-binding protein [Solirubrobacterales bacterium]|jgi:zinc transport system substrate-binding protein|nr:zinc transport system substrate-binding protein [Solirubrobacterales bacterium]
MRIIIGLGLLMLTTIVVLALATTGGGRRGDGGAPQVVAAFYPLAFAAEQIAPGARVRNLTPPGAEPHDLEIAPSAVRELKSADLVLLMGHGFQPQIERAAGTGARVMRLLDTPGLSAHAGDPHVWLDPIRYAAIARRIGSEMDRRRPAERFIARLRALDRSFRAGLSRCRRREIVTSHEAFAYLAERYRLHQIAITGISPEAEPAPRALEHAVQLVRATAARTVYFETLVSPRLADTVARETGARTAVLDPIEGLTPAEQRAGEDYFSVMRRNLSRLRAGLGCA